MLRPMVDPARPPDPPPDPARGSESVPLDPGATPVASTEDPTATTLAEPTEPPTADASAPEIVPPLAEPAAPPTLPPQAFALPSARKVVSSGLQLALTSTSELRRASIYIGLLVLGAFGPAVIALLLIVGRLGDQAGDAFGSVFLADAFSAPPQPALEAALLLVAIEALVGVALFFTISIDAQVMAIAILGGRASERPLRLWESIIRARQTFWRMAGAGTLVGVVALFVQLLILGALGGLSQSAETAGILASLLSTIVIAPLAYVATSIVIGDVGAMEALSRSWRLFRVRRLLATVVVLFTFVTSAIQLFALESGLDLVIRASEILHVSLTEGALAFATAVVLILAAIVAYGSLTFTIGAIVSAPQVSGFLGLTHFSGGIDRARVEAPKPPRGFRYVSRPMAVAMIALTGIVGLQIPAINSIPLLPSSALLELIREEAAAESDLIEVSGYPSIVDDRAGDLTGTGPTDIDIVRAEATYLVPFRPGSSTSSPVTSPTLLVATTVPTIGTVRRRCLPVLRASWRPVGGRRPASHHDPPRAARARSRPSGATATSRTAARRGSSSRSRASSRCLLAAGHRATASRRPTAGRSTWGGHDFFLLIPSRELPDLPLGWDVVALIDDELGRHHESRHAAADVGVRPDRVAVPEHLHRRLSRPRVR